MKELLGLLKEGNKSALTAALVNTVVSIIKGITYFFTRKYRHVRGNVT